MALADGVRVDIPSRNLFNCATLKFLGETDFAPGQWAGLELDGEGGKNDGSVGGRVYFSCAKGQGLFLRPDLVRPTRAIGKGKPARGAVVGSVDAAKAALARSGASSAAKGGSAGAAAAAGANGAAEAAASGAKGKGKPSPASAAKGTSAAAKSAAGGSGASAAKAKAKAKGGKPSSASGDGSDSASGAAAGSAAAPKAAAIHRGRQLPYGTARKLNAAGAGAGGSGSTLPHDAALAAAGGFGGRTPGAGRGAKAGGTGGLKVGARGRGARPQRGTGSSSSGGPGGPGGAKGRGPGGSAASSKADEKLGQITDTFAELDGKLDALKASDLSAAPAPAAEEPAAADASAGAPARGSRPPPPIATSSPKGPTRGGVGAGAGGGARVGGASSSTVGSDANPLSILSPATERRARASAERLASINAAFADLDAQNQKLAEDITRLVTPTGTAPSSGGAFGGAAAAGAAAEPASATGEDALARLRHASAELGLNAPTPGTAALYSTNSAAGTGAGGAGGAARGEGGRGDGGGSARGGSDAGDSDDEHGTDGADEGAGSAEARDTLSAVAVHPAHSRLQRVSTSASLRKAKDNASSMLEATLEGLADVFAAEEAGADAVVHKATSALQAAGSGGDVGAGEAGAGAGAMTGAGAAGGAEADAGAGGADAEPAMGPSALERRRARGREGSDSSLLSSGGRPGHRATQSVATHPHHGGKRSGTPTKGRPGHHRPSMSMGHASQLEQEKQRLRDITAHSMALAKKSEHDLAAGREPRRLRSSSSHSSGSSEASPTTAATATAPAPRAAAPPPAPAPAQPPTGERHASHPHIHHAQAAAGHVDTGESLESLDRLQALLGAAGTGSAAGVGAGASPSEEHYRDHATVAATREVLEVRRIVERLSRERDALEAELRDVTSRKDGLVDERDILADRARELEAARAVADAKAAAVPGLKSRVADMEDYMDMLRAEAMQWKAEAEREGRERSRLASLTEAADKDRGSTSVTLEVTRRELEVAGEEVRVLRDANETLRAQLAANEEERSALTKLLDDAKAGSATSDMAKGRLQFLIDSANSRATRAEELRATAESNRDKAVEKAAAALSELERSRGRVVELEAAAAAAAAASSRHESKSNAAAAETNRLSSLVRQLEGRLEEAETRLTQTQASSEAARAEASEARAALEKAELEAARVKRSQAASESEVRRLKQDLAEASASSRSRESSVADLRRSAQAASGQVESLRRRLSALDEQLTAARAEAEEAKDAATASEARAVAAENYNASFIESILELRQVLDVEGADADAEAGPAATDPAVAVRMLEDAVLATRGARAEMEAAIDALQKDAEAAKGALGGESKRASEAEGQLRLTRDELVKARAEMVGLEAAASSANTAATTWKRAYEQLQERTKDAMGGDARVGGDFAAEEKLRQAQLEVETQRAAVAHWKSQVESLRSLVGAAVASSASPGSAGSPAGASGGSLGGFAAGGAEGSGAGGDGAAAMMSPDLGATVRHNADLRAALDSDAIAEGSDEDAESGEGDGEGEGDGDGDGDAEGGAEGDGKGSEDGGADEGDDPALTNARAFRSGKLSAAAAAADDDGGEDVAGDAASNPDAVSAPSASPDKEELAARDDAAADGDADSDADGGHDDGADDGADGSAAADAEVEAAREPEREPVAFMVDSGVDVDEDKRAALDKKRAQFLAGRDKRINAAREEQAKREQAKHQKRLNQDAARRRAERSPPRVAGAAGSGGLAPGKNGAVGSPDSLGRGGGAGDDDAGEAGAGEHDATESSTTLAEAAAAATAVTPGPAGRSSSRIRSSLATPHDKAAMGAAATAPRSTPATRAANHRRIKHALEKVCLAGRHFDSKRQKAMEVLESPACANAHIIVAFTDPTSTVSFAALYAMPDDLSSGKRVFGNGPAVFTPGRMVRSYLKYDTVARRFVQLDTQGMESTTDGVAFDASVVKAMKTSKGSRAGGGPSPMRGAAGPDASAGAGGAGGASAEAAPASTSRAPRGRDTDPSPRPSRPRTRAAAARERGKTAAK